MYNFESTLGSIKYIREIIKYIRESAISLQSISEISSCFFGPRLWHIEIRHRVKQKHPQWICLDLRLSNWKFEDWNCGKLTVLAPPGHPRDQELRGLDGLATTDDDNYYYDYHRFYVYLYYYYYYYYYYVTSARPGAPGGRRGIHTSIYLYLSISIYIHLSLSLSLYIYIYIHVSICMYIHINNDSNNINADNIWGRLHYRPCARIGRRAERSQAVCRSSCILYYTILLYYTIIYYTILYYIILYYTCSWTLCPLVGSS